MLCSIIKSVVLQDIDPMINDITNAFSIPNL
jgi:hypothetical protein